MKEALSCVLRHVLIPAAFIIWATGIYTIFTKEHGPDRLDLYRTFTKEELATLESTPQTFRHYADSVTSSLKNIAKNQPELLVDHYFYNLKQINMFEIVYHDYMRDVDIGHGLAIQVHNFETNIVGIRDNEFSIGSGRATAANLWSKHQKTFGDYITEATHKYFPLVKADDERRAKEPPMDLYSEVFIPCMKWLLQCYLRGLPIAFVLFILWGYGIRNSKESHHSYDHEWAKPSTFTAKPLSLLFAVILWPILLGIDITERIQETVRRAEVVRRRTKMLSLFTKQEEKLLLLGKQMSLSEFRIHLDRIGMTKKHSLLVALLITLFMLVLPRIILPTASLTVCITTTLVSASDTDVGETITWDLPEGDMISTEPVTLLMLCTAIFYFITQSWEILTGFPPGRDGVPKRYSI